MDLPVYRLSVYKMVDNLEMKFLGGIRQIGASSVLLKTNGKKIVLDYGIDPHKEGVDFPLEVEDVDNVLLSHAHIDHSGAIPSFYLKESPTLVTTPLTLELARLLSYDSLKLSREHLPFDRLEVREMAEHTKRVNYNEEISLGEDITAKFLNSGHIPGSASILLNIHGEKIWYVVGFNRSDTQLLEGAHLPENLKEIDIVILESTYAQEDRPNRENIERNLIEHIRETTSRKGRVLLPAFAVGRSQEVVSLLDSYGFRGRVSLDGMAKEVSEIFIRNPSFIRDPDGFFDSIRKVHWIEGKRDRKQFISKPGVMVTPAGMLQGGWVRWYLKEIYNNPEDALYFVSFQVPGTLGHRLLNGGKIRWNGQEMEVKAEVQQFHLSSHSDHSQLLEVIEKLGDDTKIFLVHGEEEDQLKFAEEIRNTYERSVTVPKQGDLVSIL